MKVSEAACAVMFACAMALPGSARQVLAVWLIAYVFARVYERIEQES